MSSLPMLPFLLMLPFMIAIVLRFKRSGQITAPIMIGGSIMLMLSWVLAIAYGDMCSWQVTMVAENLPITFALNPEGNCFALAICTLWIPASIYAASYAKHHHIETPARFYAYLTAAMGTALTVAMAGNLLTLFIGYECLTFITYPLVVYRHTEAAYKAGRYYIVTLVGRSLLTFLPCLLVVYAATGTTEFRPEGIVLGSLPPLGIALIWVGCVLGIAKTAIMPLHRWLLQAMVAPTPVSAMLHAVVVVKVGLFALLKITTGIIGVIVMQYVRGSPSGWLLASVTYIALASAIMAAIQAIRQDHLKRRLAYSTISHLSQGVLAISLAPESIRWIVLAFIISHGFAKIVLFFVAGTPALDARNLSVRRMEGIAYTMPWSMACFTIASLSLIGFPPFAGFFVKELIGNVIQTDFILKGGLTLLSMLGVGYLIMVFVLAYHRQEFPSIRHEAPLGMRVAMILTVLILLLWCVVLPMSTTLLPSIGAFYGHQGTSHTYSIWADATIMLSALMVAIIILYLHRQRLLRTIFKITEKSLGHMDRLLEKVPSLPAMGTMHIVWTTLSSSTMLLALLVMVAAVICMQ